MLPRDSIKDFLVWIGPFVFRVNLIKDGGKFTNGSKWFSGISRDQESGLWGIEYK
jgi:hypothetical protein